MMTRSAYLGLGLVGVAAVAAFLWTEIGDAPLSSNSASAGPVDIAAGEILYAENCAACHGANLEGEEDWRTPREDGSLPAPPHDATGHTWHHPDSMLFTYTKQGGQATLAAQGIEFNSGMPGFGEQLSDEDIWNILAYIKSIWPERERAAQADRTAQDIASKGDG
ncbi:Cytochrome c6 [Pelagimonas phthalicica]|uniref:Cytochrome c6 n=3 Tax=Alphaproteobacteria TaxID=28211 RepID=A0A238JI97_9RHOB|nr:MULTISPECIES: c-type cytochrome [Rhodobacterales]MCH9752098.1 c-type cytochrome [Alphaproteobacteria bacterium]TDS88706.1 cbb3-type cytochrome c oxidase subunit III [Pelagimonas phthalicica]CUK25081.1 putative bifunctional cbb3-type cytochrome c oxidase subunit II/cytochrome c [Cognatishimia activa]SMX30399.1 Cytochrome c6 [Pelagimonas phthalicica]